MDITPLGLQMRKLRKLRGKLQKKVARQMRINTAKLRAFEHGELLPRMDELTRFCDLLQPSTEDLEALWNVYKASQEQAIDARLRTASADQGQNAQAIFTGLYPFLYASETPISGGYARQSEISAALADAYAGLHGKRVLDIGCGYGTTTMAITPYSPAEIVAVDSAPGMIELLEQVLLSEVSIDRWMRSKGVERALEELYAPTVTHLQWMRRSFCASLFRLRAGILTPLLRDGLELSTEEMGLFDVIIGNNYLHWPILQRRDHIMTARPDLAPEEALYQAQRDALLPLASLLKPGGIAVLMVSKDFVVIDDDPERDTEIERTLFGKHPVYHALQEAVNRILKVEYRIERTITAMTPCFLASELPVMAQRAGFMLTSIHQMDWAYTCDPIDGYFVRLPLLLGGVDLLPPVKMDIVKRARQEVAKRLPDKAVQTPMRVYWFFLILKRIE